MGIIHQFFNNFRLVLMQSLSCIMPFCRYKNPGPSRGDGNKDRRQFEHIVGSIYGNFDPQTGIPLHQNIVNDRRHGKVMKRHKSGTRHRHRPVSKDSTNEMPDNFDREGESHLFAHVSILNMVLGDKATTGSSLSVCQKSGHYSNTKGHLSSDDADREYSSSYNDGDKRYTARSCHKPNRQSSNVNSNRRITFEDSITPSTSDDNNVCPPKPTEPVLRNCASPTKSNLRKLKLRIANNLQNSCSCDNNLSSTSDTTDERQVCPSTPKKECKAFDNYVSPTSSNIIHRTRQSTNDEMNRICNHCCSATPQLRKRKRSTNCIDSKIQDMSSTNTSEDDKTNAQQTSTNVETNDRCVSPIASKDVPTRPRGLKITVEGNFNSRTSSDEKAFPAYTTTDDNKFSSTKSKMNKNLPCTPPNTEEMNIPACGDYSSTNTSEDGKECPKAPAKKGAKSCHFSPTTPNVTKKCSPSSIPKKVRIGCDQNSSNTSEEDKCRKTASKEAKNECCSKCAGKALVSTSSDSQDDQCECKMSGCVCDRKPSKPNCKGSCHKFDKIQTNDCINEDLNSGSDDKQRSGCACKKNSICCGGKRQNNIICCNHVENEDYSISDATSEDTESDNIKVPCKCLCRGKNNELNIVYEHTLEGNLFPLESDRGHINSILALEPLTSATESSNEEKRTSSDLTMDEEHGRSSVSLSYRCSCEHTDSVRKLPCCKSSDSCVVSTRNICITDGSTLKRGEDGHNTTIPKCVINHLIDHNVTFHIVKVCDDS